MTVSQNLMLGLEETNGLFINKRKMHARVARLLKMVNLDIDPDENVRNLSTGKLQLLQIAKAISIDAKVISFDEPTASLSRAETEVLFKLIEELKVRIPDYPDGNSGGIRTLNRRHPDTLSINLILH